MGEPAQRQCSAKRAPSRSTGRARRQLAGWGGPVIGPSAEEITQGVFLDLWQHPEKFDSKRGTLRSFLLARTPA
jgi:DNA-directed RNA polymerase specialized sigma24 family protein